MEIQTLKKSKKKPILIGGICAIAVLSVGVLATSRAKYKLTESINIANGVVNYKVPDFNVVAMYKSDDGTNYTEITDRMPESGYIINEEKSYCNLNGTKDTNAILKTINGDHVIANLIKGDKCYLYFDKQESLSISDILATLNIETSEPEFYQAAKENEGIFKTYDDEGTSYYWRGAVTNNYVKFANFCWRIVRINGDGSIRLIYDGTTCHTNGQSTSESIAIANVAYNLSANRSEYVGYTYTEGSQRGSTEGSSLKKQTETWYKTNITDKGYDGRVVTGKFCNDRNTAANSVWGTNPTSDFYYAAYGRMDNYKPSLGCDNNDKYIQKVGAITADEVIFAGGTNVTNTTYYLYNGQNYWTMTPSWWRSNNKGNASVYTINTNGELYKYGFYVTDSYGIRPVINLRSDTIFKKDTDGTLNNPYEVI